MPSHVQSHSPPPRRRRALQERSSAHSNERSPTRSLRMVSEQEDVDFYTATPFPTKVEQILLPIPGKGQQHFPQEYISDTGFSYADTPGPSSSTWSSPTFSAGGESSARAHSVVESWDVSSTVDPGNSPPGMWDDDPLSSKSSLPEISSGKAPDYGSEPSEAEFSDDEMMVLPTATPTIKAVVSEPPTSPKSASSEEEEKSLMYSSPNVQRIGAPSSPIGAPSSPNFVTLDNSSVNFLPPGTSHSHSDDSDPRTNSLSSYGTVVRHPGVAPWIHMASSTEHFNGSTASFHSSPPLRSMTSFRSVSNGPSGSRSRSATSSSRSLRSVSDIQTAIDSGVPIQYPRIRAPSSSSRAESSIPSDRDFSPGPASGRWNPHLSRVSSVWDDEEFSDEQTRETSSADVSDIPAPARAFVTDADEDEHLDSLTNLPSRPTFPHSLSSGSKRSNSMRSMKRPGTGSSNLFQIIPTWAKVYYCADALGLNSALSIFDQSRPSSARSGTGNSSVFNMMPTPLNIPRPRSPERPRSPQRPVSPQQPQPQPQPQQQPGSPEMTETPRPRAPERVHFSQKRLESDPRDPRAHWVPTPEPDEYEISGSPRHRLRHSWSPHMYHNRRKIKHSSSAWTCPSMDSTTEPVFGRRNIQVYSFVLGFIFPLAWIIASFVPLPPKPKTGQEVLDSDDDVEKALESQLVDMQQRRYDNARWWRNLNRWMISLGVVIIVIIITLAVIGTTTGF